MKNYIICLFVLTSISLKAQIQDTLRMNAQDSTLLYSIQLDEIVVSKNDISGLDEERKKLLILKRRVYKTYPYAKLTSEKLAVEPEPTLDAEVTVNKKATTEIVAVYAWANLVDTYGDVPYSEALKPTGRFAAAITVRMIRAASIVTPVATLPVEVLTKSAPPSIASSVDCSRAKAATTTAVAQAAASPQIRLAPASVQA